MRSHHGARGERIRAPLGCATCDAPMRPRGNAARDRLHVRPQKSAAAYPLHLPPRLRRRLCRIMRRFMRQSTAPPLHTLRPALDRAWARSRASARPGSRGSSVASIYANAGKDAPSLSTAALGHPRPANAPSRARRVRPHRRARRLDLDLDRRRPDRKIHTTGYGVKAYGNGPRVKSDAISYGEIFGPRPVVFEIKQIKGNSNKSKNDRK